MADENELEAIVFHGRSDSATNIMLGNQHFEGLVMSHHCFLQNLPCSALANRRKYLFINTTHQHADVDRQSQHYRVCAGNLQNLLQDNLFATEDRKVFQLLLNSLEHQHKYILYNKRLSCLQKSS